MGAYTESESKTRNTLCISLNVMNINEQRTPMLAILEVKQILRSATQPYLTPCNPGTPVSM